MSTETGFLGTLQPDSIEMKKLKSLRDGIGEHYDWTPMNYPHITLIYLGKEYSDFADDTNKVPSEIKCRYGKLDFIGKSLVCKVDILDAGVRYSLDNLSGLTKYPPVPFYHITLGRFKNSCELKKFRENVFLGIDIDDITGKYFSIDRLSMITVSQPDKVYKIKYHL